MRALQLSRWTVPYKPYCLNSANGRILLLPRQNRRDVSKYAIKSRCQQKSSHWPLGCF